MCSMSFGDLTAAKYLYGQNSLQSKGTENVKGADKAAQTQGTKGDVKADSAASLKLTEKIAAGFKSFFGNEDLISQGVNICGEKGGIGDTVEISSKNKAQNTNAVTDANGTNATNSADNKAQENKTNNTQEKKANNAQENKGKTNAQQANKANNTNNQAQNAGNTTEGTPINTQDSKEANESGNGKAAGFAKDTSIHTGSGNEEEIKELAEHLNCDATEEAVKAALDAKSPEELMKMDADVVNMAGDIGLLTEADLAKKMGVNPNAAQNQGAQNSGNNKTNNVAQFGMMTNSISNQKMQNNNELNNTDNDKMKKLAIDFGGLSGTSV